MYTYILVFIGYYNLLSKFSKYYNFFNYVTVNFFIYSGRYFVEEF